MLYIPSYYQLAPYCEFFYLGPRELVILGCSFIRNMFSINIETVNTLARVGGLPHTIGTYSPVISPASHYTLIIRDLIQPPFMN